MKCIDIESDHAIEIPLTFHSGSDTVPAHIGLVCKGCGEVHLRFVFTRQELDDMADWLWDVMMDMP